MKTGVGRGGARSAPRRRLTVALFAALFLPACYHTAADLIAAPSPPAAAPLTQLRHTIDSILDDPSLERATWGLSIQSMDAGDTLYDRNARKLIMPASTMKVVTLAATAARLGWDFRYHTRVFTVGTVEDGILKGDLLIVGDGDPTLDDWDDAASACFAQWATQLEQAGIHAIDGRIIGDDNAFDDEAIGAGWAWDDLAASYATGVGALQFNENTAQVVVSPGTVGQPAHIEVRPPSAAVAVRNLTTTAGTGGAPLSIRPLPREPVIEVTGSILPTATPVVRNISVPNATIYFVNAVRNALVANGIAVRGAAEDIDDLTGPLDRSIAVPLTERQSPPLRDIAVTMMKMSQNLFAETLLRTLGGSVASVGSVSAGRVAVVDSLTEWGIPPEDILMVDGSGLSRYNLMTPGALISVLGHVYHDDALRGPFLDTLPIAGVDGTLAGRMKGTAAAGKVHAKTGSFSNARAVVGYVDSHDGEPLAFAIVANNYGVPAAAIDTATDAILVALAKFSRQ